MIIPRENLSELEVDRLNQIQDIVNDILSRSEKEHTNINAVRHSTDKNIPPYYVVILKPESGRAHVNILTLDNLRENLSKINIHLEDVSVGEEEDTLELWLLEKVDSDKLEK